MYKNSIWMTEETPVRKEAISMKKDKTDKDVILNFGYKKSTFKAEDNSLRDSLLSIDTEIHQYSPKYFKSKDIYKKQDNIFFKNSKKQLFFIIFKHSWNNKGYI